VAKNLLLIQEQILALASQDDLHPNGQPRTAYSNWDTTRDGIRNAEVRLL